jgi:transcriptional regulator with XRE-family HTH domain
MALRSSTERFLESELNLRRDPLYCSDVDLRMPLKHRTNDRRLPSVQAGRSSLILHERESFVIWREDFPPESGERLHGRHMILKDKLQMLMVKCGLNGQKLARLSHVSDSEISRILQGKSRPGLDNAFRLARAVHVTLDYLADDSLDAEPPQPADHLTAEERRLLTVAQKIGASEVLTLLENIRFLGYDVAMSRLVGGKPVIEIEKDVADMRPAVAVASSTVPVGSGQRASSAIA